MPKTKVKIEEKKEEPKGFLSLFSKREKIYPARVRGRYRNIKWLFMFPLLAIYYVTPWLRWDRGEGVPDQAVLIDTLGRKFYFFWIELWPQEVIYAAGLLLLAAMGLFFVTSIAGRVWCGYACPQTVWTDLFLMIERKIEGNRSIRMKFDKAAWSLEKVGKKLLKHSLWIFISLCTGGAWVFYFTDAPTLVQQISEFDIPFASAFWIGFLTISTYLFAGFAREHVCTYMCPYARFQGAMFDADTLIVSYDQQRGEPRGKNNEGDCVDCGRCEAVCPTGIDIRNGQQYQCINCALCVDACNEVMDKVGKKRGLIRYNSMNNSIRQEQDLTGIMSRLHIIRPRTVIYGTIILVVASTVFYGIFFGRTSVELNVQKDRQPLFIQLADGSIRNAYTVHILNKRLQDNDYIFKLEGLSSPYLSIPRLAPNIDGSYTLNIKGGKVGSYRVLVDIPKGKVEPGQTSFTFTVKAPNGEDEYNTVFVGPKR